MQEKDICYFYDEVSDLQPPTLSKSDGAGVGGVDTCQPLRQGAHEVSTGGEYFTAE